MGLSHEKRFEFGCALKLAILLKGVEQSGERFVNR